MAHRFDKEKIVRLTQFDDIDICVYPVPLVGDESTECQLISARDKVRLRRINHPHKRKEFLASRLALAQLDPKYRITYEGRIPYLDNGNFISISHAHAVAAAVLSKKYDVGIDVESERDQLYRISDKFLHPDEKLQIRPHRVLQDLHIYWGAKEALYKIWKKGELDFSHELRVDPFEDTIHGETTGQILKGGKTIECRIHFQKVENYYLVVAWADNNGKPV